MNKYDWDYLASEAKRTRGIYTLEEFSKTYGVNLLTLKQRYYNTDTFKQGSFSIREKGCYKNDLVEFIKKNKNQYSMKELQAIFDIPEGSLSAIKKEYSEYIVKEVNRVFPKFPDELILRINKVLKSGNYSINEAAELINYPEFTNESLRGYVAKNPELKKYIRLEKPRRDKKKILKEMLALYKTDRKPRTLLEYKKALKLHHHIPSSYVPKRYKSIILLYKTEKYNQYLDKLTTIGPKRAKEWKDILDLSWSGVSRLFSRNPEFQKYLVK